MFIPTLHIISSAVFFSQHGHWFLFKNKIEKIGDNAGSCDNHTDNACKIEGVAE